jgi:RNA polymerase sigma-B factor
VVRAQIASYAYSTQSSDALSPRAAGDGDAPLLADNFGDIDPNLEKVLDIETVRPLIAALPDRNGPCCSFDSSRT